MTVELGIKGYRWGGLHRHNFWLLRRHPNMYADLSTADRRILADMHSKAEGAGLNMMARQVSGSLALINQREQSHVTKARQRQAARCWAREVAAAAVNALSPAPASAGRR